MTLPEIAQIALLAGPSKSVKSNTRSCKLSGIRSIVFVVIAIATMLSSTGRAELYINEIYWDPPSNPDSPREYIELRGTPGMSLANHYLLFIENEDNATHTGSTGTIEAFFDLNGRMIGENGFMSLRQKNSPFSVDPGASNYINTSFGSGWGGDPASSSIGAWDQGGEGEIENSGFTAMLIRNNGVPLTTPEQHFALLGQDLDVGNDGLDNLVVDDGPFWKIVDPSRNWMILDSIGVFGEEGEATFGRVYGKVNFGQESSSNIETGATYVSVGYEIELVARWGNSTSQTAADWHVANITDKPGSGSQNWTDLRQSCRGDDSCHPNDDGDEFTPPQLGLPTESNQDVPYGTQLLNTFGRPNFLLGDYNKDGYVNSADYTVWRDTLGQVGSDQADLSADANHNYVVDTADYTNWKANFGTPISGSGASSFANALVGGSRNIPEPTAAHLMLLGAAALVIFRGRGQCSELHYRQSVS